MYEIQMMCRGLGLRGYGYMYTRSADLYDAIYANKDYRGESDQIHALVQQHNRAARTLLDVACGTGSHLEHLGNFYTVQGLDMDGQLLNIARSKLPGIALHQGDMESFSLHSKFDVITCLFSSVGYLKDASALNRAIGCMSRHLTANGLLIIEPWFSQERWTPGRVDLLTVEEDERKIIRLSHAGQHGKTSVTTFHYLVGTADGLEHLEEQHRLTLFTDAEYRAAFATNGLEVRHDPEGIAGRGLYLGWKPA